MELACMIGEDAGIAISDFFTEAGLLCCELTLLWEAATFSLLAVKDLCDMFIPPLALAFWLAIEALLAVLDLEPLFTADTDPCDDSLSFIDFVDCTLADFAFLFACALVMLVDAAGLLRFTDAVELQSLSEDGGLLLLVCGKNAVDEDPDSCKGISDTVVWSVSLGAAGSICRL